MTMNEASPGTTVWRTRQWARHAESLLPVVNETGAKGTPRLPPHPHLPNAHPPAGPLRYLAHTSSPFQDFVPRAPLSKSRSGGARSKSERLDTERMRHAIRRRRSLRWLPDLQGGEKNGEISMNQHCRWIGQNQRKKPHSDLAREAPANAESAPGTLLPRRNQGKLGLLHDWHTRWRLMSQGG